MSEPFDVEALHALIDTALAEELNKVGGEPGVRAPLPLTLLNTEIFSFFADLITPLLNDADRMQLFDEMRHRLYDGIGMGSARELYTLVVNCRRCPKLATPGDVPYGNRVDPDVLFVHDLPYHPDVMLERTLQEIGFAPDRVCHSSVIRCAPREARLSNADERERCHPYLLAEIQCLSPKLVVLLGAAALEAVLGEELSITKQRGTMFSLGPWFFLPTYSLGYLAHRDAAIDDFITDLKTSHRLCYGR